MKIDFYVLKETGKQRGLYFVCQLIEKCYLEQESVFVHTATKEEAENLDQLLWTYRDDSFLPHHLHHSHTHCPSPIHIGEGHISPSFNGVLFNLHSTVPLVCTPTRLVEIVFSDLTMQQLARARYKQYRDQGHDITTYNIKANDL